MKKRAALRTLFDREEVTNGIIFCNRKRDIGTLLESLQRHGYSAVSLHGDMDQHIRLKMLDEFKSGAAKYLIASDVAARGLDIPNVSHVFNFDVPTHAEDYVHRIGRTGRAGRTGAAYMLATRQDDKYVQGIEELIKQEIAREELKGLDAVGSENPTAKGKPRRRKSDAEADSTQPSTGNGRGVAADFWDATDAKTRTSRQRQNRLLKKLKKPKNLQSLKKRIAHREVKRQRHP